MRKPRTWLLVPALAMAVAACGGIDSAKLEDEVSADAEAAAGNGETVDEVTCADDIESETGVTFECQVEFSDGSSATANGVVIDGEEGNVEYTFTPN